MNPLQPGGQGGQRPEDYILGGSEGKFGIIRNQMSESLVILTQVHHRRLRGASVTADKRVARKLLIGGDAYSRNFEADPEAWAPVIPADCWVKAPGLVVVHNDESPVHSPDNLLEIGLL